MLLPKSAVAGVDWPAVPAAGAAQLLSVCSQLERTQWLEPEQVLARQLRQLGRLTRHARATVPFYADRLDGPDGKLTPESFRRVPILTREDLQRGGDRLVSSADLKHHGATFRLTTSGSTGMPVTVVKTGLQQLIWNAITLRGDAWAGRPLSGRLASIRRFDDREATAYPDGSIQRDWGPPASALYRTGPSALLHIATDVSDQLRWLRRQDPDYLLTFPSNARALAELCLATKERLGRLRHLGTVGEVVDEETRSACRRAWGVRVSDMYSTQEAGYLALQCPQNEHYHVQAESAYVEIIKDDGGPCAPGEVGRLVATPLHSFAMPLLRYAVGDYARAGPPCDCGRGAPVIERIMGRVRNMVRLPSGEQRWPMTNSSRFRSVAPVRQYQLVQTSLQELDARLVVERPLTPGEESALRELITEAMGHPFTITFSYCDRLQRAPTGKFEEFASRLA